VKRLITSFLVISALGLSFIVPASGAVKAGASCTKLKATTIVSGYKYTCIKSGKKLVWSKGVKVAVKATPSSTQTPTPTPSPTSAISITNQSDYRPSEECKLKINGSGNASTNQSHEERDFEKPDLNKSLRVLVFPVDFPDLMSSSSQSPMKILQGMTEDFSAFYKSQSNGKVNFNWTISPKFTRLDNPISSYGVGRANSTSNSNNYWKLNFDLQDLALKSFKREEFDIFIAVSPVDTSEDLIATSPAFMPRSGYWAGNWIGGDYWRDEQKWIYPAHEFGHYVLGLDDLGQPSPDGRSSLRPLGHYDIMNSQAGPEYTAWNRWVGGLISDRQILCLPMTATISILKPIEEVNDFVKGLVVPISPTKVIVIENRAAIGYDKNLPSTSVGVIAYSVDVSIPRSNGPMRLIREPAVLIDKWYQERGGLITPRVDALKVGESLTYLGITINVIGRDGNDMFVKVSRGS